ncbi:MAG: 2-hydroxychromene-2-carboxylate isomerase [Hyphomicrobiaceae bacterium]|jgi:2-hydroxychromene-2-carboxylate isomerase
MIKMEYYLSLNSPWTYLGSARFINLVKQHNVDVTVKPANFGDVFAQTGGLPLPKRAPQRQAYRMFEMKRWRDELNIPIQLEPVNFPSNEARGVHAVIATKLAGGDALGLSAEIGRSLWEMDLNIGDMAVIEEAGRRAGVDVAAVLEKAPSADELDAMWQANTKEAVDKGVFGAPSYRFEDGEIMWGQDRVHFVAKKLAELAAT